MARSTVGKWMITISAAVLLIVLYYIIFIFSGQSSEESTEVSMGITEKIAVFLEKLIQNIRGENAKELHFDNLEHIIRKTAHFMEYACMGVLVYWIWRPWKKKGLGFFALVVIWVLLSAAADEFHQTFVPGRDGNLKDVLLDTCGGGFGFVVAQIPERIIRKFFKLID